MGGQRVVFFILPFKSHLNSALNLATILHSNGFSISVICTRFNSPDPTDYPEFTFHTISDGLSETEISTPDTHLLVNVLNMRCVDPFKECLSKIISHAKAVDETVACLIADAFWYFTKDVADSLELRRLILAPCNVSFIGITLGYALINDRYLSVEDKDAVVQEFAPLRIKDFPTVNQEKRDSVLLKKGSNIFREMMTSDGIIFNTFKELESPAISRLENRLSSPVFHCGPFHISKPPSDTDSKTGPTTHSCISWLDKQPPKSVIYVSIGTLVTIEKSAFLELAWGIAATNRPFLWVVRPGSVRNPNSSDQFVLPDEFIESVGERGIFVEWAPQPEVLAHPSVGGFWNHGGWNSVLESICAEVPMICQPFIGDHMMNARYASEVWKIGLYFEERVEREPVQKAIERLMEGKESEEMRVNIACLKNKAKACVQVGGSSYKCMNNLIGYIGGSSFDA